MTNIRTFVDPQNPTRVALLMDVPDMDALKAAMQIQAAADAMAFDRRSPLAGLIQAPRAEREGDRFAATMRFLLELTHLGAIYRA